MHMQPMLSRALACRRWQSEGIRHIRPLYTYEGIRYIRLRLLLAGARTLEGISR